MEVIVFSGFEGLKNLDKKEKGRPKRRVESDQDQVIWMMHGSWKHEDCKSREMGDRERITVYRNHRDTQPLSRNFEK